MGTKVKKLNDPRSLWKVTLWGKGKGQRIYLYEADVIALDMEDAVRKACESVRDSCKRVRGFNIFSVYATRSAE
jgi:hypothetical protein